MRKENTAVNSITEGSILQPLLAFFFPILLGSFFQQLYNTVDAVIVGQFVGKEALAAVGATGQPIQLLTGFLVGLASGSTVIISQFYGAQRTDDVREAIESSLFLSLVGGLLLTAIGLIFSAPMLRALDTPADCYNGALLYIQVYFLGTIPTFLYNMGTGILRAFGDSRSPMYILVACCLANIVLDILFVRVFSMGVFGAALATILSQLLSAVLIFIPLLRNKELPSFRLRKLRNSAYMTKRILQIGLPAGLQSSTFAIANLLAQAGINSFGTDMVAGWTAYGKADAVFWMISGALGIAVTTFVGQNFGARKYDRIKKCVRISLILDAAAAVLLSLAFCLGGSYVLRLFNQDPAVLACGNQLILLMAPYYLLYIGVEIFSAAIRGTGDALFPMLMNLGGICVFRVLWLTIVLPLHRTLATLTVCYPISWVITSALFTVYYLRGKWLKKRILDTTIS